MKGISMTMFDSHHDDGDVGDDKDDNDDNRQCLSL
jgi:hypothetical protein